MGEFIITLSGVALVTVLLVLPLLTTKCHRDTLEHETLRQCIEATKNPEACEKAVIRGK